MKHRRLVVVLAVVVVGALAASAQALGIRMNNLTFSRAVALPGVELGAGTYSFEALEAAENLVRVWDRSRTRVLYTGFTRPVNRPGNMDPNRTIVFGEAARGEAPRITVWFPIGTTRGHQFLYER